MKCIYVHEFEQITEPKNWSKKNNGITFVNTGNATALINGMPLAPGQSISLQGRPGETDCTTYIISFVNTQAGRLDVIVKVNK
jgi:hypothetical protein